MSKAIRIKEKHRKPRSERNYPQVFAGAVAKGNTLNPKAAADAGKAILMRPGQLVKKLKSGTMTRRELHDLRWRYGIKIGDLLN